MSDGLLDKIVTRLIGPTMIVNDARKVIFASEALRDMLGPQTEFNRCEGLIFAPPLAGSNRGCCWDLIDSYLGCGRNALWPMQTSTGDWLSTICQLSAIDIAGAHGLVHLRVRPLREPLSRDVRLFEAVRERHPDPRCFKQWVTYFFTETGKTRIKWLDTSDTSNPTVLAALRGLEQVGQDAPFDIRVRSGPKEVIRSVIAAGGPSGLVLALLNSPDGILQPGEVLAAWAAVRVAAKEVSESAFEVGTGILSSVLSPREREVLGLVLRGMTDPEIAQRLGLSLHTARNHVRHIMEKCNVRRRMQLASLVRTG